MNLRPLIWVSWCFNLLLAGGVLWLATGHSARHEPSPAAPSPQVGKTHPAAELHPEPAGSASGTQFDWSQIASADLKVYRDNLLATGCPWATVRDILQAEINNRFELRRQTLLAEVQSKFWDFARRGEAVMRREWGQPLDALDAERRQLMQEVLGKDYDAEKTEMLVGTEDAERRLAWLPPEKRDQLQALEQKHRDDLAALTEAIAREPGNSPSAEDLSRLRALNKELEDSRKELLTPEELEEFALRSSDASHWADDLSGFEPTEDEWRKVARLQIDHNENLRQLNEENLSDEERQQRLEKLQAELDQGMRAALGERYARYELANDGQYLAVQKVTQRYGLSDNVAVEAYQLQQAATAEAERLLNDSTLSAESREAALSALESNTERTLSKTLSQPVLKTYLEYGGGWLKNLGRNGN